MTAYREGVALLQVRPAPHAGKLKVTRVTQRMPETVDPGAVVIRVRLRVDADAWRPLEPDDVIDVPAARVLAPVAVAEDTAAEETG